MGPNSNADSCHGFITGAPPVGVEPGSYNVEVPLAGLQQRRLLEHRDHARGPHHRALLLPEPLDPWRRVAEGLQGAVSARWLQPAGAAGNPSTGSSPPSAAGCPSTRMVPHTSPPAPSGTAGGGSTHRSPSNGGRANSASSAGAKSTPWGRRIARSVAHHSGTSSHPQGRRSFRFERALAALPQVRLPEHAGEQLRGL